MDITYFVTWFIDQVFSIFTKCYSILDNITFLGTSLLRVLVTIMILTPLLSVLLTISKSTSVVGARAEKVKSKKERTKENEE